MLFNVIFSVSHSKMLLIITKRSLLKIYINIVQVIIDKNDIDEIRDALSTHLVVPHLKPHSDIWRRVASGVTNFSEIVDAY